MLPLLDQAGSTRTGSRGVRTTALRPASLCGELLTCAPPLLSVKHRFSPRKDPRSILGVRKVVENELWMVFKPTAYRWRQGYPDDGQGWRSAHKPAKVLVRARRFCLKWRKTSAQIQFSEHWYNRGVRTPHPHPGVKRGNPSSHASLLCA